MTVGDLVKHRVSDMIGIVLRTITTTVAGGDPRWAVVRWNNGMEFSERTINLVSLCS